MAHHNVLVNNACEKNMTAPSQSEKQYACLCVWWKYRERLDLVYKMQRVGYSGIETTSTTCKSLVCNGFDLYTRMIQITQQDRQCGRLDEKS